MVNYILHFILHLIGFLFMLYAVDYKRTPESKIKPYSKDYWIIALILLVGALFLRF